MFSTVHLHLLLNHLPIIVTGLGLLLLVLAMWRRNELLLRVSMWFFVGAAVSALPTYLTGEGAEDAVKKMPGVTEALIEKHSDIALIAAIVVGVLGLMALYSLWRYRRPAMIPSALVRIVLLAAVAGSALMAYTGLLGGEIRHTEVRPGFVAPAGEAGGEGEKEH